MASKKLKRAATVAAGIGAAYLASQALGKKKPVKKTSSLARRKGDTFGASTTQEIEASKPRDTFESDTAATYENVPAETFLKTPGGFPKISPATPEQVDEMMEGFGPMAKEGKFISKKMFVGGLIPAAIVRAAKNKKGDRFTDKDSESFPEYKGTGDRFTEEDIKASIAPYRAAKNKRGSSKADITSTEGSFEHGGSVVARGNKLARSKPTKLF